MLRKFAAFFKKHPYLLLFLMISITGAIAYFPYIFGDSLFMFRDIGSDTAEQYLMQYSSIVNHIRNGNLSLWDFTNGFGTSMYQLNLFNPSLWLLYLAGIIAGPQVMAGCLIYLHLLLLILAGFAAWKYLSVFRFPFEARLLAAYLYAFNGFLTVWGQHYQFSVMLVYLPLLLYLLERSMEKKKFSPAVVVCTAFMMLCTYYLSYMVLLFCAMYVPVRLFQTRRDGVKKFFLAVFRQGFALLLGVFMGILNMLPSYALVFNVSARMSSDTSFIQKCIIAFRRWPNNSYYKTLICRLLSSTLEGIDAITGGGYTGHANFYDAPNLFYSVLLVILLVQFVIAIFRRKNVDLRTRAAQLFTVLAAAFSLCIAFGSFVFNAFSAPFCRHTFLLMPLFALLTACMLNVIIYEHSFSIIGALISVIPAVYLALQRAGSVTILTYHLNALITAAAVILTAVLLFLLSRKQLSRLRHPLYLLLCLTLGLNVTADTYTTAAKRGISTSDENYETYEEDMYGSDWQNLQAYLQDSDSDFYRLEKDYQAGSVTMDSAGQYYRGIGTYNSTSNRYILEFLDEAVPELYYINTAHWTFRQITDEMDYAKLFGIKYVVSKSAVPPASCYELEQTFGSLYLYRNVNWTSFASFYTQTVAEYDFSSNEALLNTDAFLSDYLLLDDEAAGVEVNNTAAVLADYQLTEIDSLSVAPEVLTDETGAYSWILQEAFLPFNRAVTEEDGEIVVTFDACVDGSYDLQIRTTEALYNYKTVTVTDGEPVSVTMQLPAGTTGLYVHNWNGGIMTTSLSNFHFYSAPASRGLADTGAEITVTDTYNDSHILCSANLTEDGYLFFPIPYEDGWTITANGEELEILQADYGFSAVKLSAGTYDIELNYHQPLAGASLLIMLLAWIAFILLTAFHIRLYRSRNTLENYRKRHPIE